MDWNSRRLTAILENALLEDRATRDATSYACIDPNQRASATIIAKQECILAGIGCVARILDVYAALDGAVTAHYEVTTHPEIFDGVRLHKGASVAVIRHNARVILSCERVILNFLQRMSGIATLTRKFVEAVSGTKARILDTRKTAPGLRVIDKTQCAAAAGRITGSIFPTACSSRIITLRWPAESFRLSNVPFATVEVRRLLKSKSALWTNWNRHWLTAPKRSCWTTCRSTMCVAPSSAARSSICRRIQTIRRKKRATFRSSVPAEFVWKMFAPMPTQVSISFPSACSRTRLWRWT